MGSECEPDEELRWADLLAEADPMGSWSGPRADRMERKHRTIWEWM